jgi:hypothetical protein
MPGSWIQDEPEQEVQLKPDISNVRAVETSVIRNTSAAISLWTLKKREPSRAVIINFNPMKTCRF